jgi:hypothetical protein
VERGDGVVGVVLAPQERRELELPQIGIETLEMGDELLLRLGIGRLVEELVEDLGLLDALGQRVVELEVVADVREGAGQILRALRVVPDAGLGRLAFQLVRFRSATVDVKGTPSRSPAGRRTPSRVRNARS